MSIIQGYELKNCTYVKRAPGVLSKIKDLKFKRQSI